MALKNDRRSMALKELLPPMREWAEWVSLQKEVRDSDAACWHRGRAFAMPAPS
jgi:hypothetical protein